MKRDGARVVVMTKDPLPGRVKTRLIPALGSQRAAELHRALALHTVSVALSSGLPVHVALSGRLYGEFAQSLRKLGAQLMAQGEGDLGDRLAAALTGPGRQICIGTDCPTLAAADLRTAAQLGEVCIGPADDGGYWLIAIDGAAPGQPVPGHALFRGIPWSTARTLGATLARADQVGLSVRTLARRYDLDRPDDLVRLAQDPTCPASLRPFLS